jgi:Tfp pilus assembly protein PilO
MNKNLTATILIVISIGIYFTVTKSIVASAQAVKAQNDQLTAAVSSADEIIAARESIIKQYNAISPDNRDRLDKMIPSAVDNIRLVIDLNNLALRNHFALSDVKAVVPSASASPGQSARAGQPQAVNEPTLDKVQVTFTAVAGYEQFIQFLQDLEMSLRVMDLTHLNVQANDDGTYTFMAQFQTYWLRQ